MAFSYYFYLSDMPEPPKAIAGDDAASVHWRPVDAIDSRSDALHDGHYNILKFHLG